MKIVSPPLPQNCRIICVSDIHGHCDAFARLLQICGYDPDNDFLFILGDILEKGPQNIETLRLVKKLCANARTICIQGNNDTMCVKMAFSDSKEKFLNRLAHRPANTFCDMAARIGISDFPSHFEEKRAAVVRAFHDELTFIKNLPLAIDTKDFLFVHAGIENRTDWQNSDPVALQATDWFLRREHPLAKTVVVGHYPCYNYHRGQNTNLPIIDNGKRMIDIDGGCGVKWAGQLNAFCMIKNGDDYRYETQFLPLAEKRTVKRDVTAKQKYIYNDFANDELEPLREEGAFLVVRQKSDGTTGRIPKNCTAAWGGVLHGWINLDCYLSVRKGESFYPYGEVDDYAFGIAQNGQVGLIPSDCLA